MDVRQMRNEALGKRVVKARKTRRKSAGIKKYGSLLHRDKGRSGKEGS